MTLELVIKSPIGYDPAVYHWPNDSQDNGGALEIIETIKWVYEDFPELDLYFSKNLIYQYDTKSYQSMKVFCDKYNNAIDKIIANNLNFKREITKKPTINLVKHIINQAYIQSIIDPDKLNQYEPFSPEVYGETSFEFITQMIEEINIKNEDVFIDLGSGYGQVVLQVAACTNAKLCVGIEKAEIPAGYAQDMSDAFKFWMNWFGKKYAEYSLMKGDFFHDKYRESINNGTFIFVNNFAFGPKVDHMLKLRFQELKDGARIVSSKSFCPLNFRITDRTLSDIGSIMRVEEIQPKYKGSVSWTGKPVSYYLHTIDRRKLEEFFLNSKNPRNKNQDNQDMSKQGRKTSSKCLSNSNFGSSSNDSTDVAKEENFVYGPTTRKAWSEWCNNRKKEINSSKNISNKSQSSSSNKNSSLNNDQSISNNNKKYINENETINGNLFNSDKKEIDFNSDESVDTVIEDEPQIQEIDNNNSNDMDECKFNKNLKSKKYTLDKKISKNNFFNDNDSKKQPGRPRKKNADKNKRMNFNGLDLLHQQTVLSISSTPATEIPFGCIDQKLNLSDSEQLNNYKNNCYLLDENDNQTRDNNDVQNLEENTEFSKNKFPFLLYNLDIDNLVELYRHQVVNFLQNMQNSNYKELLSNEIEIQKQRKNELNNKVTLLENQIKDLLHKGIQSLKIRFSELNIVANDPEEFISKATEIIVKNKELKSKIKYIEEQINESEKSNQQYFNLDKQKLEEKPISYKGNSINEINYSQNINLDNNLNSKNQVNFDKNLNLKYNSNYIDPLNKSSLNKNFSFLSTSNSTNDQFFYSANNCEKNKNIVTNLDNCFNKYNKDEMQNQFINLSKKSDSKFKKNSNVNSSINTSASIANKNSNNFLINKSLKNVPQAVFTTENTLKNNSSNLILQDKIDKPSCEDKFVSKCNNINNNYLNEISIKKNDIIKNNLKVNNNFSKSFYQVPEFENRLKNMIEAAFNDGNQKDDSLKEMKSSNKKEQKKIKTNKTQNKNLNCRNEQTKVLEKNSSISDLSSINSLYNKLSSNDYSALNTNNLHTDNLSNLHHLNLLNENFSSSQNNISSQNMFLSSSLYHNNNMNDTNKIRDTSTLKLTLKIDRERDSYALVKSPPKLPTEKITPKSPLKNHDISKRKNNPSPDNTKNKKSKSPKYSASFASNEPERRLILKVTNGQSRYIERTKDKTGFDVTNVSNNLEETNSIFKSSKNVIKRR